MDRVVARIRRTNPPVDLQSGTTSGVPGAPYGSDPQPQGCNLSKRRNTLSTRSTPRWEWIPAGAP